MQLRFILSFLSFIFPTLHAASTGDILAGNAALTKVALNADIFLVALTPQSGFAAAQQVPISLHNLTASMASTLINDTSTDTYIMFDPATEDIITESYGLLANTIEELMFDLFDQEQILASYLLQCVMYRTLLHFNNTFAEYSTYMHGIVGDIYHHNITRNETANVITGVNNATAKYAMGPTPLLFEA